MMFIDYTESPYFMTMPDIITDWTPENPKSPMANEYLPAVEQYNFKTDSLFYRVDRPTSQRMSWEVICND